MDIIRVSTSSRVSDVPRVSGWWRSETREAPAARLGLPHRLRSLPMARRLLRRLAMLAVCCLLPALAGCGGGDPNSVTAASVTGDKSAATDTGGQYVIGAGDQLGISVYHAPELSVPSLPVRPDGRISMPLIPDILAAGKTPSELGTELQGKLKEYVKDPIVTVMVTNFVGPFNRQVRVIGEATDPQAIPYRDHMTVLDVMIAVKGLTKYAAGNRAVIVRQAGDKHQDIKVHLADLLKNGDIDQNVEMQPGDTLIIPQSWF